MNTTRKQSKTKGSPLVFEAYIPPGERPEVTTKHRQLAQAVENAITQIGEKKTTDAKIENACNSNNVDENRVRIIAGLDKGGMNEYKIVRL
jgi:hypothetical protein